MSTSNPQTTDQQALDQAAFSTTEALRQALQPEQVLRYTLDAVYASAKAFQTSAALQPFRPTLATLPTFDVAHLDRLEDLARALRHCQMELARRVQGLKEVPALVDEGYELRAMMVAYLEVLSFRKVVSPELVKKLREGSGYRDLAEDLNVAARELRSLPAATLSGAVTQADLLRGPEIAHAIQTHLGLTEVDLSQEALLDARARLATLLLRSQAQLRRAMDFLRFDQGDAATLVPSLYVPAGPRAGKAEPTREPGELLAAVHDHLHQHDAPAGVAGPGDNPFEPE